MSDLEAAVWRLAGRVGKCTTLLWLLLWFMLLLATGGFIFQIATVRTVTRIEASLQSLDSAAIVAPAKAGGE